MFGIDNDMTIYITRGDVAFFSVTAEDNGEKYKFQPGDVVRMKVTEKKACENVMFQKDFPVTEEAEKVDILLTEEETKIGEVISKPTDYWYEIELNPYTNPQTIVGYDEDGAKILKLFPEGRDLEPTPVTPEDIPVVDNELSLTSDRPVQNQAIARAITGLGADIKYVRDSGSERMATIEGKITAEASRRYEDVSRIENDIAVERARINNLASLEEGSTTGDAELADIRVGADGKTYTNAGESVRGQITDLKSDLKETISYCDKKIWETGNFNVERITYNYQWELFSAGHYVDDSGVLVENATHNVYKIVPEKNTAYVKLAKNFEGNMVFPGVMCNADGEKIGLISSRYYEGSDYVQLLDGTNYLLVNCGNGTHRYKYMVELITKTNKYDTSELYVEPFELVSRQNFITHNTLTTVDGHYVVKMFIHNNRSYIIYNAPELVGCCYDIDSNYLGDITITQTDDNSHLLEFCENTDYIKINMKLNTRVYSKVKISNTDANYGNDFYKQHIVNKPYDFNGKKAVFVGDSITKGFTRNNAEDTQHVTSESYPKLFSRAVGMGYNNRAIGGSCMTPGHNNYDAVLAQLQSDSLDDVDYVFIAAGTNDRSMGISLTEFASAIDDVISYLKANFAGEVFFIAPINRVYKSGIEVGTMDDYRKIISVKATIAEYNFINGGLFHFSEENDDSMEELMYDTTHPTEKGYRMYAKELKSILL